MTNDRVPDLSHINYGRIFDDKVALSEDYRYDGANGGAKWKKRVRGYWLSKLPDFQPILDWAEDMDDQLVTDDLLKALAAAHYWMTEVDVRRTSGIIWGFLRSCLKGEAETLFELAPELNGYEAWRIIVRDVHNGQNIRLATLRRLIKNPPSIQKLEDVNMGITRFENLINEFKAAG